MRYVYEDDNHRPKALYSLREHLFLAVSICYWINLDHLSDQPAIFTDIPYLQSDDWELCLNIIVALP